MSKHKGVKLRFVLGLLVIGSVLLTAVVGGYFAWKANQTSLMEGYLESNYQYAKKLASNTGEMLEIMRNNIDSIAKMDGEQMLSQKELDIWYHANEQYFNSIIIVEQNRKVLAVNSNSKGVQVGAQLTSKASYEAVERRRPLISDPFVGSSNRLIVLISSPIFDNKGAYIGFAGGTIFLEENNALNRLLKEHFYGNGSYVYVADKDGHLIFHPDKTRIRELITTNEVINKAVSGLSGSQQIVNSEGKPFFAGYAHESFSGWAIVAQTPTSILEEPLKQLVLNMLLQSLPLSIVILLIAWWVSYVVVRPLHALARFSEEAISSAKAVRSKMPKTNSIIYEVKQLNQSINNHLSLLNREVQLDGLTGIANRKTFDLTIVEWIEEGLAFSLILLDIDHFKQINDKYGHMVGDEVLRYVSLQLGAFSRTDDLCFRYGGEEFGILVRHAGIEAAAQVAERLRERIAAAASPTDNPIYVSIGVSHSNRKGASSKQVIGMADKALYQSKAEGRNRITVYSEDAKTFL